MRAESEACQEIKFTKTFFRNASGGSECWKWVGQSHRAEKHLEEEPWLTDKQFVFDKQFVLDKFEVWES